MTVGDQADPDTLNDGVFGPAAKLCKCSNFSVCAPFIASFAMSGRFVVSHSKRKERVLNGAQTIVRSRSVRNLGGPPATDYCAIMKREKLGRATCHS
jgi:hypothetical protein